MTNIGRRLAFRETLTYPAPPLILTTALSARHGPDVVASVLRNPASYTRLARPRDAWRAAETDITPTTFMTARMRHALCRPPPGRSAMVADRPRTTRLDRLSQGHPPSWLHLVAQDRASGHTLDRVGI